MKKLLITATLMLTSMTAFAFQSGDRIKCFDDVSGEVYQMKIMDLGDEEAYVRIKGRQGGRFYPSSKVEFDINGDGASFIMLVDGHYEEEIFVFHEVSDRGEGIGYYADRGDSRGIECEMK